LRFAVATMLALALAAPACGSPDEGCKDDYDCDGTQVCNLARHACEPLRCRDDPECLDPGYACVDNQCLLRNAGGPCRDERDHAQG